MSIGLIAFACIGTGIVMSAVTLKLFLQAMTEGEPQAEHPAEVQRAAEAAVVAQHPNLDPSFVRTP